MGPSCISILELIQEASQNQPDYKFIHIKIFSLFLPTSRGQVNTSITYLICVLCLEKHNDPIQLTGELWQERVLLRMSTNIVEDRDGYGSY